MFAVTNARIRSTAAADNPANEVLDFLKVRRSCSVCPRFVLTRVVREHNRIYKHSHSLAISQISLLEPLRSVQN